MCSKTDFLVNSILPVVNYVNRWETLVYVTTHKHLLIAKKFAELLSR